MKAVFLFFQNFFNMKWRLAVALLMILAVLFQVRSVNYIPVSPPPTPTPFCTSKLPVSLFCYPPPVFYLFPMLEYLSLSSNFPLYNFFSSQTESVHAGGVTCTSTTTSCCGKYFVGLAVFSSKLIYKCVFLSLCVSCFRPKPRTLFKPGTM